MASPDYARCWAKGISSCGGKMSREHPITKGSFPSSKVYFKVPDHLPLPKGRVLSIDSLAARCLCETHNNLLGTDVDQAFIDWINAFREVDKRRLARAKFCARVWPLTEYRLNGLLLERAILKMAMGFYAIQKETIGDWEPADWLPKVIFGQQPLGESCGLSLLARVGDAVSYPGQESVGFGFGGCGADGKPVSAFLQLRTGWKFLCTWEKPVQPLRYVLLENEMFRQPDGIAFHPGVIHWMADDGRQDLGLRLVFDWTGEPANHEVTRLRSKYPSHRNSARSRKRKLRKSA